jgi:hypothetical protein
VPAEKDILYSPEDDSSLDENPCGEEHIIPSDLPVDSHIPQWHTLGRWLRKKGNTKKKLHLLAHRFRGMPFGADQVFLPSGPVKALGPIATQAARMWVGAARMTLRTTKEMMSQGTGMPERTMTRICPCLQRLLHNRQLVAAPMHQEEVMPQTMGMRTWRIITWMSQAWMPLTRAIPRIPKRQGWASFTRPRPKT